MGNILTNQAKRMNRHLVIIAVVCLLISQNLLAAALFDHIVQPYVGTQLMYDSNVLRLPSHYTPVMSGNRTTTSSFIKQIKAGLTANWQISQQQLLADVSVDQNWFSTFNELNYTGHNLLGQWNWRVGSRLKGEISYNNRLTLGSFQQINRLINNMEKRENYVANGAYEIFPDWYLHAGFTRNSTRYPSELRQNSNLLESSQAYGLRYFDELRDDKIDFYVTITDGKYTSRDASSILDNAYTRVSYNAEAKWYYSVKTRIRGQIGYVSQTYRHIKSRNFSDIVASGDILWEVTRKSSLLLFAWREISPTDDLSSSFSLSQGIALTPSWTWSESPKIQVELPLSYKQQTNLGATGLNKTGITQQQSSLSTVRLNLNYKPIPNVEMSAFALYENRHSNNPIHSYQDQSVGLTMKVSF